MIDKQNLIPVTNKDKIVTDINVINQITNRGLDPKYVEFSKDYNINNQYGKEYTLLETGEKMMTISGLPKVRLTDGSKLIPGFEQSGNKYYIKNNLFEGYVTSSGEIHLSVVESQPNGLNVGDECNSKPILYIGNEIVSPKSVTILQNDVLNKSIHDNVLEFDYGVCKRRIRIMQGRFKGSWIFKTNPGKDIRIEYNHTGKIELGLGKAKDIKHNIIKVEQPQKDIEFIPSSAWSNITAPLVIGDSAIFNPSLDGWTVADIFPSYTSWAGMIAQNGTGYDNTSNTLYIQYNVVSGGWYLIRRSHTLFNTSSLPDAAVISAAALQIYFYTLSNWSYTIDLVSSSTISNYGLQAGDHQLLGSTIFGSVSPSAGSYNNFYLNASGISAINKTGYTKYGLRNHEEITGTSPFNSGSQNAYYASAYSTEGGASYYPIFTVTYTVPTPIVIPKTINFFRRMRG